MSCHHETIFHNLFEFIQGIWKLFDGIQMGIDCRQPYTYIFFHFTTLGWHGGHRVCKRFFSLKTFWSQDFLRGSHCIVSMGQFINRYGGYCKYDFNPRVRLARAFPRSTIGTPIRPSGLLGVRMCVPAEMLTKLEQRRPATHRKAPIFPFKIVSNANLTVKQGISNMGETHALTLTILIWKN